MRRALDLLRPGGTVELVTPEHIIAFLTQKQIRATSAVSIPPYPCARLAEEALVLLDLSKGHCCGLLTLLYALFVALDDTTR